MLGIVYPVTLSDEYLTITKLDHFTIYIGDR